MKRFGKRVLLQIENIKRVSNIRLLTQTFNNSLLNVHKMSVYLLMTTFYIHRVVHLPVFLLLRGQNPPGPPDEVSVLHRPPGSCPGLS